MSYPPKRRESGASAHNSAVAARHELAKANRKERFTSLAHHITPDALRRSFRSLDGRAAPGVDGVTKRAYGQNLEENLKALHGRLKSGEYRATPVLRVFIEKPDGGKRPLGIPALEDKVVQGAVVEILRLHLRVRFQGLQLWFSPWSERASGVAVAADGSPEGESELGA